MRLSLTVSAALAAALSWNSAQAAELIPVAGISGSTFMTVYGINDANVIVGYYGTSDGHQHSFFGPFAGPYTTFDFGDTYTQARAINDHGYITGVADVGGTRTQFERFPNGQVNIITKDGNPITFEYLQGINSKGLFVGNYRDENNRQRAYYGKKAKYLRDFVLPSGSPSQPRAINDAGDVAGASGSNGFVFIGGDETIVAPPVSRIEAFTSFYGIDGEGALVSGNWSDWSFAHEQAILFDTRSKVFLPIHIPGATVSGALGMNAAGLVAVNSDAGSFIYCPYAQDSGKCPSGGIEVADPTPTPAVVRERHVER